MGQILGPDKIKSTEIVSTTSVKLSSGSIFSMSGRQFYNDSDLFCNLAINGLGGLDVGSLVLFEKYYLYAVLSGGNIYLVASLSSTGPSGFLIYKKVGFFRTDASADVDGKFNFGETGLVKQYYLADLTAAFDIGSVLDSEGSGLFTVVDNLVGNTISITALMDIHITLGGEMRASNPRAFLAVFDGLNFKVGTIDMNGTTNPSVAFSPKIFLRAGDIARVEGSAPGGTVTEARVSASAESVLNIDWN